jgi:uncharacterized Zn finger protein
MSRWDRWGWYPKAPPKRPPPERGIKVRTIGATWWGQRWIEALEKLSWEYANRLARGRTYARAGRVHDLEVEPGKVTARVTGSRPTPYKVTLRLAVLAAGAWDKAVAEMAKQAVFAAELLAGEMPKEIDRAFRAAGRSLFPAQAKDLATDCSCPDWANPCKHVAATHYVLGEALDRDPFLLFELRGRGKDAVLAALRKLRVGADGAGVRSEARVEEPMPAVSLAGKAPQEFERLAGPVEGLRFRVEPPASPVAVLRQLGMPPSWSLDEGPAEVLGPLYAAASALASELALEPSEAAAPLPEATDRTEKVTRTSLRASRGRRSSKSREGTQS